MGQPQPDCVDINEYLTAERRDNMRYEYHRGELYAMAGGTIVHSTLCTNIASELRSAVDRKGSCVPFNSEMKVEIKSQSTYIYPDAGVACPNFKESKYITGAITNPKIVVEVISEISATYDFDAKRRMYFSLPSVQEYVLIQQEFVSVTVMRRRGDLLKIDAYPKLTDAVYLESIDQHISVAEIYKFTEVKEE